MSHYGLDSTVVVSNLSFESTQNFNNAALWCVAEYTFKLDIKWIFCSIVRGIRSSVALNYCDVSESGVESSSYDSFRDCTVVSNPKFLKINLQM